MDVMTRDLRAVETPGDPVEWDVGEYELLSLAILRRHPGAPVQGDRVRFDVLALAQSPRQSGSSTVSLPEAFWRGKSTSFEARPGQINVWMIPLPEELIQAARARLEDKKSAG